MIKSTILPICFFLLLLSALFASVPTVSLDGGSLFNPMAERKLKAFYKARDLALDLDRDGTVATENETGYLLDCYSAKNVACGIPLIQESNEFSPSEISEYRLNGEWNDGNTGPENVYYFDLSFPEEVTIKLSNFSAWNDFELILLMYCNESQAIAAGTNPAGEEEIIKMPLEPGRYFILVEGFAGAIGTYDLSVDWNCREDAETGPIPIHCGEIANGSTVGFKDDFSYPAYSDCIIIVEGEIPVTPAGYSDALYRFDLNRPQTVHIDLNILTAFLDLEVLLLESVYLSSEPDTPYPGPCIDGGKVVIQNLKAGTYWISIDGGLDVGISGTLPAYEGLFTLNLNCFDLPRPCDLKGGFVSNGSTLFSSTLDTLKTLYFTGISCIEDQFSLATEIYGRVYTYYSEEAVPTVVQLESENLAVTAFVFDCNAANPDLSCIGSTNSLSRTVDFDAQAGHYYQIVVLSQLTGESFQLSIPTPAGPCSHDIPEIISPGQTISGQLTGFGNDVDTTNVSFYRNCSSGDFPYDGEDRVFLLNIRFDPDAVQGDQNRLIIILEAESAMGLFLFNYQCGAEHCLGKIELPEGGGTGKMALEVDLQKDGTYYLILDQARNSGSSTFLIKSYPDPGYTPFQCESGPDNTHLINFAGGLLDRQNFIDPEDIIFVDYKVKGFVGDITYLQYDLERAGSGTTDIASIGLLKQDSSFFNLPDNLVGYQKCGFENGEPFEFKVVKENGLTLILDPVYDDNPIFAHPPDVFQAGATTFVNELRLKSVQPSVKVGFESGNVNLRAIPSDGLSFEGHIDVNGDWQLSGLSSYDWIRIYDADVGEGGQPLTRGHGPKKVLVRIDQNPKNEIRRGLFAIVAENDFSNLVIIRQLPNQCAALSANIRSTLSDVSCHGEATGSILLTISDHSQDPDFIWQDGISGPARSNLPAGNYQVVLEISGCRQTLNYTIHEPAPLVISIDTIQDEIDDEQGFISLFVTGGTAPYIFTWWSSTGFQTTTTPNSGPLSSGEYEVSLEDANGCIAILPVSMIDRVRSIKDLLAFRDALKIYPNPGKGLVHLDWQSPLQFTIDVQVISALGSAIYRSTIPPNSWETSIDLTKVSSGMYVLLFSDGQRQFNSKVIIK